MDLGVIVSVTGAAITGFIGLSQPASLPANSEFEVNGAHVIYQNQLATVVVVALS
jgi:hypothetical protein